MPSQRHHAHRHHLRGFGYFRRLGPGLITGAADDDPSGIGTYSQIGAAFGYGLLWTALISLPLAGAVQETAGRLGLASGKGLARLIRDRFSRPVVMGAVALVVGANVFNIGADLGAMAASTRLLVPVPALLLIVIFAVAMIGLEVFLPYHRYAKVLRWLVLSLVAYVAVLFVVNVPWGAVARDTFTPHVRFNRRTLEALVAILGTTISPYLFFWQAGEEVEETHDHPHETPARTHIGAMRLDVIAGMLSAVVVMFAIMVASAATLHAHGITNIATADQAARALRPIAGRFASLQFALGVVTTGLLAVPVLAGSTAYALSEAFSWQEGLWRRFRDAPGFYSAMIASVVVGVVLNLVHIDPIRALFYAAVLNGIAAPPLILLMLILSNSHAAVGEARGGRISDALVLCAFLVMAALVVAYFVL